MVSIIIPTYNASRYLAAQLNALHRQTVGDAEILIIDSSSTDNTLEIANSYKLKTFVIPKSEFDHGGTRTFAGRQASGDSLVYMTQDAIPVHESAVENLLKPLKSDDRIGMAFGRQIPSPDATPFAIHPRMFNYPEKSYVRTLDDRVMFGLKAAFCSNSFAVYRRSTLEDVGWFKEKLLFGEDMHACARMLMRGYKVGYVADAMVYHSHNYSLPDEFRRYFAIGMFHKQEQWLLEEFGGAEGEGLRYVKSELSFLLSTKLFHYLPISLLRSLCKFAGYKLGYHYDSFSWVRSLGTHAK